MSLHLLLLDKWLHDFAMRPPQYGKSVQQWTLETCRLQYLPISMTTHINAYKYQCLTISMPTYIKLPLIIMRVATTLFVLQVSEYYQEVMLFKLGDLSMPNYLSYHHFNYSKCFHQQQHHSKCRGPFNLNIYPQMFLSFFAMSLIAL